MCFVIFDAGRELGAHQRSANQWQCSGKSHRATGVRTDSYSKFQHATSRSMTVPFQPRFVL